MCLQKDGQKNKNQDGLSLIELLVSMTVFLIGIAAVYGLTQVALVQKNTISSRTDQLRSIRIALEYIRRDTLNAGFGYHRTGGNSQDNVGTELFGLTSDGDNERDILTAIVAGNDKNSNTLNFGGNTDVMVLLSRDMSFNGGNLINYTGAAANSAAVDITTDPNAAANCNKYDLYLFESSSGTTQVIGMVTSKIDNSKIQLARNTDDPFGLNQLANGTGENQSLLVTTTGGGTIKRLNMVSYSVTSAGVLVRKRYGNQALGGASGQIETRELAYGVSDFQVKYFMEDGTTVDDPSLNNNGRTNQMKMNNIVQVQISITIAADNSSGQQQVTTPITIKEFISTKNLRYETS